MSTTEPPKYTEKPEYGPVHSQVYSAIPVPEMTQPVNSQNNYHHRYLTGQENRFLLVITGIALFTVLCTSSAIFLDKHAIAASFGEPSFCMLTDTSDCRTVYTSEVFRIIVEVCVRVDLLISIILFVTAVVLTAFRILNSQLLVGFLLCGIVKTTFINIAILLIVTNNVFYYDTVYNTMVGNCGQEMCVEEETANIVMAFLLLSVSAFATFIMTLFMLALGNRIIRKYDESTSEMIYTKYESMTHQHFH